MKNQFLLLAIMLSGICLGCDNRTSVVSQSPAMPEGPISKARPNPNRPDNIDLSVPGQSRRGFAEAEIINTANFEPPIRFSQPFVGEIRSTSDLQPKKTGLPEIEIGESNDLRPGGMSDLIRVNILDRFPGISQTQWNPPDPSLAVGPNHIVETVNQSVAFYDKAGNLQFQQRLNDTSQPGFFDEIGAGDFVFDPKCFYDHHAERFFIVACEVYDDIEEAYITFAISDDNDPNGIWFKYRSFAVIQIDDASYWVDYPGLGFDQDGIYVTGNLFLLAGNGSGFGNALFRSFEKAPLLSGQTAQFTDIRNVDASSVQAAQHFGGNEAPYFVSRNTTSRLRVIALNDAFGEPAFSTAFVDVPEFSSPSDVPNGGAGNFIDALDGRLMNVHWRDGRLWTCHGIDNPNFNGAVARWYELETGNWPASGTPVLLQSGNVEPGPGISTFFPAVYTDANNNAALVMAQSSAGEFAGVVATGRLNADPVGNMGAVVELDQGNSAANGRWGDYFDIALDPDGRTFWMVGETRTSDGWQTSLNSFSLFVPGDINGDGVVNLLDVGPFVELVSTGTFDIAADLNGDGLVNLLDVSPFVVLLTQP